MSIADLNLAFLQAVAEYAKRRMGIFTTDRGANQFSGTFLRVDDRYCVATAGHCIYGTKQLSTLRVVTYANQSPGVEIGDATAVLYRQRDDGERPLVDVSILTISPGRASALGVEWIGASQATSTRARPGARVCLAGFPEQLVTTQKTESCVVLSPGPFVYVSQVSDRLPKAEELKVPVDASIDFFVEYEKNNILGADGSRQNIKPVGMSGCGVFVVPPLTPGEFWSPSGIELAGIQSTYLPGAKLLRANRIEYVFQLLKRLGNDSV